MGYFCQPPELLVGFAKWVVPGAPYEDLPKLEEWPKDGDQAFADKFFGAMSDSHKKIMGDRPHWYLELIVVKKEYQGKGAGGLMIRYGVEKADEAEVEAYLDASPSGRPVYERYGFKVLHTRTFFDGAYVHCIMHREARKKR